MKQQIQLNSLYGLCIFLQRYDPLFNVSKCSSKTRIRIYYSVNVFLLSRWMFQPACCLPCNLLNLARWLVVCSQAHIPLSSPPCSHHPTCSAWQPSAQLNTWVFMPNTPIVGYLHFRRNFFVKIMEFKLYVFVVVPFSFRENCFAKWRCRYGEYLLLLKWKRKIFYWTFLSLRMTRGGSGGVDWAIWDPIDHLTLNHGYRQIAKTRCVALQTQQLRQSKPLLVAAAPRNETNFFADIFMKIQTYIQCSACAARSLGA